MSREDEDGTVKEVPAAAEGTGARDATVPVEEGKLTPVDGADSLLSILNALNEKDRAKFAHDFLMSQPSASNVP